MIGILAYGSLITHPGHEIESILDHVISDVQTPFPVEYARRSQSRAGAPTLVPVPVGCGIPVKAVVLVLREGILAQYALDALYRRETHQEGNLNVIYDDQKQRQKKDALIIESIENHYGQSVVYYTSPKFNFAEIRDEHRTQEDKADLLAHAAIESVNQETFDKGLDGIQYLADNIDAGVNTLLTETYQKAILQKVDNAKDLRHVRLLIAREKGILDLPDNVFSLRQSEFRAIHGQPIVYWVNQTIRELFARLTSLRNIANPKVGLQTGENVRFLRFWWEPGIDRVFSIKKESFKKVLPIEVDWCPYMKGGAFQKWYGNQFHILNWKKEGAEIKSLIPKSVIRNPEYYFQEGITWSLVSSTKFAVRYLPQGFIFDVGGSCGFPEKKLLFTTMAVMNSPFMNYSLRLLNPTINFQIGDIIRVPFRLPNHLQKKLFDTLVPECIRINQVSAIQDETTFDFCIPKDWQTGLSNSQIAHIRQDTLESEINNLVYALYEISIEDRQMIEGELSGGPVFADEGEGFRSENDDENLMDSGSGSLAFSWLSFTIGILLNRFHPGTSGALGSAIYRRADFAIGSLPEPTEVEFNELVGEPSQFAYIDEQGGRHVFSPQVEVALQKLALTDGIAVFDPNHPRDLPSLVSKALELMLGQAQAQEVIQQAAGGDLRKFLEKDFFTQHHIKQYRKRPIYWPIQSSKRSYGFVLFHEKIDRNTFYALQQEPYLPTKRRAVQLRLEELGKKVLTAQGAARKPIEKEMEELRQLAEELAQFAKDLETITRGGYEPEADWIDDGVILRMAPLWSVIPLWKSEPKKYWEELAAGKYDWSRIAMKYWPERVKKACIKNKSYAIAHGHEDWYQGK